MTCALCGLSVHAGGCDEQAFYQWQRWGRLATVQESDPVPLPPTPLTQGMMAACDEAPPLSGDIDISPLSQGIDISDSKSILPTITVPSFVDGTITRKGISNNMEQKRIAAEKKSAYNKAYQEKLKAKKSG